MKCEVKGGGGHSPSLGGNELALASQQMQHQLLIFCQRETSVQRLRFGAVMLGLFPPCPPVSVVIIFSLAVGPLPPCMLRAITALQEAKNKRLTGS